MAKHRKTKPESSVRIIAGRWKGRRIPIAADGIRPTGDRIRETLFNWLQPHVRDARCLDLFAGTGAFGIEALSRGAGRVVFVEQDRAAAKAISDCLVKLESNAAEVLNKDATRLKLADSGPFDIVFLDPPFDGPEMADLCRLLEKSGVLADNALIYIEMRRQNELPELPPGWAVLKEQTAGQVRYALATRVTKE
jgi:16S rRNA (guanine966-N2)-methyltransferase